MSEASVVKWTVTDHIATVAFNRPDMLNACNMQVLEEITNVFDMLSDREDVWCAVLKGNGRAFCVGADQKERPGMTLDAIRRRRRIAPIAFGSMRNFPHPVIAQVHGYALGGGLEMALMCDMIVAAEGTVMGLIETVRASIPAGGGTQLLPRLIGPARAKELIFTGRKFKAEEALAWGMLNYVVPEDRLEARTLELAREITAAAPVSCTQAKRAINSGMDTDFATGVQIEAALYERILTTQDRTEALAAYREKRAPVFTGH
jgi:enoyl-CoA hydratase/carnithine racemase